jgi:hypothetical protein
MPYLLHAGAPAHKDALSLTLYIKDQLTWTSSL